MHVPLIFAGLELSAQTVYRRVETVDVAPTIAAALGAKCPSGAIGVPVPDALPK